VLQLVADRAIALTGANGVAIALRKADEIICGHLPGTIAPDKRAKLNPNSGFSGACFSYRSDFVRCDDTENDREYNDSSRSPLGHSCDGRRAAGRKNGAIGLIEAFSSRRTAFRTAAFAV